MHGLKEIQLEKLTSDTELDPHHSYVLRLEGRRVGIVVRKGIQASTAVNIGMKLQHAMANGRAVSRSSQKQPATECMMMFGYRECPGHPTAPYGPYEHIESVTSAMREVAMAVGESLSRASVLQPVLDEMHEVVAKHPKSVVGNTLPNAKFNVMSLTLNYTSYEHIDDKDEKGGSIVWWWDVLNPLTGAVDVVSGFHIRSPVTNMVVDIQPKGGDVLWLRTDEVSHWSSQPMAIMADGTQQALGNWRSGCGRFGSALLAKPSTFRSSEKRSIQFIEWQKAEKRQGTYNKTFLV